MLAAGKGRSGRYSNRKKYLFHIDLRCTGQGERGGEGSNRTDSQAVPVPSCTGPTSPLLVPTPRTMSLLTRPDCHPLPYMSIPPLPPPTSLNLTLFGCFFLLLYRPDLPSPNADTSTVDIFECKDDI